MPTKRYRIERRPVAHLTPAAIAAWQAGDYWALHGALGLRPWQMPDWTRDPPGRDEQSAELPYPGPDVIALKAALVEMAGPPPRRWRYGRTDEPGRR